MDQLGWNHVYQNKRTDKKGGFLIAFKHLVVFSFTFTAFLIFLSSIFLIWRGLLWLA
jgi:hypothetical protein